MSTIPDLHQSRNGKQHSLDRLPPHDPVAERAYVGCAILDPQIAPEVRPDLCYDARYRSIGEVVLALAAEGKPIDESTVTQRLTAGGIADAGPLVTECLDACPSPANFTYWRDILLEKFTERQIVRTAQEAIEAVYGNRETKTSVELLDDFERSAMDIRQKADANSNGESDKGAALRELVSEYEQAAAEGKPRGLATGFYDVDLLLGGIKPPQLIILAARPSVGKTAWALNALERIAIQDQIPAGLFSLEMGTKELLHRLACSRARVDGSKLNEGRASDQEIRSLTVAHSQIQKAPLCICDQGGLTLPQLSARARRMVQRHGIKLLVVDYLGLIQGSDKQRSIYEKTTLISNGLKTLAKELQVPVLALAQLNRDSEREGRVPRLSDLRDSGSIEQDADVVALLHRDETSSDGGRAVSLIIAKQRNGRTGVVRLTFLPESTRFESAASGL